MIKRFVLGTLVAVLLIASGIFVAAPQPAAAQSAISIEQFRGMDQQTLRLYLIALIMELLAQLQEPSPNPAQSVPVQLLLNDSIARETNVFEREHMFVSLASKGYPTNTSVYSWVLESDCSQGIDLVVMQGSSEGLKEVDWCGKEQRLYESGMFDSTEDYKFLTATMMLEDGSSYGKTTFTLTAYDRSGRVLGSDQTKVALSRVAEETDYDLDIVSPRSGVRYEIGDRVTVRWDHENLEDDVLNVTLEGLELHNRTQRHVVQRYPINRESASFTIPEEDSLGILRSGKYELSIWVTNIKDGSVKGVSDSITVYIEDEDTNSDMIEAQIKISEASIAYQNILSEFNAHRDLGHDVSEAQDLIEEAEALLEVAHRRLNAGTYDEVIRLSTEALEFLDEAEDLLEEATLLSSMAIGVGAYEGTYPTGEGHSFGYHPQGVISVYVGEGPNIDGSLTLVLTSYEPVLWDVHGPGIDQIGQVFASGYYDQEVVGLDVPVTMRSYQSGDSEYFYAYKNTGTNFEKLHDYVMDEYETRFSQYYGSYQQDEVRIEAYKG